jgi:hypothetical protein
MRVKYLGDALDHWKGSFLSTLLTKELIANVAVDPMITDDKPWLKEDIDTYRKLLRLEPRNQICHDQTTFPGERTREEYFHEIPQTGDVFLDPDTGIATRHISGTRNKQYIKICEIRELLGRSDRILIIYQHSPRLSSPNQFDWLRRDAILHDIQNGHCAIWPCGQVAAFFLSLNKARIDRIERVLNEHRPVIRVAETATASQLICKKVLCPACHKYVFKAWPQGWDAHAAYNCPGTHGDTPRRRKATFRQRFANLFLS